MFENVNGSSPYFSIIKEQFEQVIAPIYGDQTTALAKIAEATDRICEVLLIEKNVMGVLVYKTEPNNEFEEYGAKQSLELKTLFVVNAHSQSGKGVGTLLIDRIKEVAKNDIFDSITVTISETRNDALTFFQKKEFKHVGSFADKYKKGEMELLHVYTKSLLQC